MTRKTIWLWVNCLIVAALLLASCAPIVTEEEVVPPLEEEETALPVEEEALPPPTPTEGKLQVHFIDVGQGDSILVDLGDTEILIDGGGKSPGVAAYLTDYVDGPIEVIVATHPHADHIGGLIAVLDAFEVGEVWHNGDSSTSQTYAEFMNRVNSEGAEVHIARLHDTIQAGGLSLYVHHPADLQDSTNNNSIVLHLAYGDIDFFFTGDAEQEAEGNMMILGSVRIPDVEILKVGHHGSSTSSSSDFLAITNPETAIYLAGEDNRYGHPHDETITALSEVGAEIYGTDINGTIIVTTDGQSYSVVPEEEGAISAPQALPPTTTDLAGDVTIESIDLEAEVAVITNNGDTPVNLTGWRLLRTVGNQEFVFPAVTLQPGTGVQVVSGRNAEDGPPQKFLWTRAYIWNNDGDPGKLYDSEGNLVSEYP